MRYPQPYPGLSRSGPCHGKEPQRFYVLRLLRRLALACLPALAAPCGLQAQQPAASAGTEVSHDIEEIVVTARRPAEIIPTQKLEGKALEALSSHSVADALRYFSGIQIKDYGGIGGLKTVNIRSMGSQHVGVFFDGIQIGNAQNGTVDLGRFSLDNMEAVTLHNGQKSAIFQSAKDFASASAIYMETRRPRFDSTRTDNLKATLKGGSFKTVNPSLLWEHRCGDKVRSSVNAEYLYTSGEYRFRYAKGDGYDTTEIRKNGDVRLFRAEAALFGDLPEGAWRTKVYFYDSERGYPGYVDRNIPGRLRNTDRQWDTNLFLQGSLLRRPLPFYTFSLKGKYAYDYLHYLSDEEDGMYIDNRYRQQEVYLSAANLFSILPGWSADLSVDAQWNGLEADLADFAYPKRYTVLAAAATSLQLKRVSLQGSLLYTHVTDVTRRQGTQAGTRNEFTPALVASCKPLRRHDLSLRAFYKRIFRMPTFNDLYYTQIGNKNLKPEYTEQYDAGAVYAREWYGPKGSCRLEVQLDGYFNRVKNKIVAMSADNQFRWMMLNLGYVEIRGADAVATLGMTHGRLRATLRIAYTYQRAQDFTDPASEHYGDQIPYIPWHSGSAVAGIGWGEWSLNYSFIYTGERYEQAANTRYNYVQPWYTHDLSLAREIGLRRCRMRICAEVNNLLNQQYEVVQCYPMPGTNFRITLSLTL